MGQSLAAAGIALAVRLPRRSMARLAVCLLAADALVFLALISLGEVSGHFNHGPRVRRGIVVLAHLGLALATPWAIWGLAVDCAARRRVAFGGGILLCATALGAIAPGVRFSWSRRPAHIERVEIPLPRLPKALDGVKVVLASDIHVGPRVSARQARLRLTRLEGLKGDLFLVLGDLGIGSRREIRSAAALLDDSAQKQRRFAVVGNHERWIDEQLALEQFREHGFTALVNDSRRVTLRGTDVWLVGVNDPYTGADDLRQALSGVPEDAFVILLAHGPDIVRDPLSPRADLIVAGHTHGGQVVLPMIGPISCGSGYGARYASGLCAVGRSMMFVTRGLGDVIVPLRLYCPPEVAVLTLRAAPAAALQK